MAVESLSLLGINRAYSDFAGSRACEELINLRPTSEGLVPVKEHTERMTDIPWSRVFLHHTTHGPKYIVIGKETGKVYAKWVELSQGSWTVQKTFFTLNGLTGIEDDVLDHVSVAFAGNIVLFSVCDQDNSKYLNYAATWKMNDAGNLTYVDTEANPPEISFSVTGGPLQYARAAVPIIEAKATTGEVASVVESAVNEMLESDPHLCIGPVIIAIAFKTKDGSTFWTGHWQVYDPIQKINAESNDFIDSSDQYYVEWIGQDFFTKYGYGYHFYGEYQDGVARAEMNGTTVSVSFSALAPNAWNKETSLIQSVEIYCSRPAPYLDIADSYDGWSGTHKVLLVPPAKYSQMDLGNQPLYHQASIELASLAEGPQTVNLTFGGNQQVTEDLLDTDAGALVRYGRLLSYNARFHYWDSVAHIDVGVPSFSLPDFGAQANLTTADVFVRYADDDQSELVWVGEVDDFEYLHAAYIVIAPSLNIKEVITYAKGSDNKYYIRKYRMDASSAYNYSVCVGGAYSEPTPSTTPDSDLEALIPSNGKPVGITSKEPAAINVTEQYNPFVFLVEHSYLAPGNILDVQPQMAGLVDASYGRDPLNVFTERGLYALTQGSANVLYGAFLPINQLVISRRGGGVPTEQGIFFLADGALWLVSGRRCTLVSDALHLGPHKYIRACTEYKKIAGVDENYSPDASIVSPVYDVSDFLSKVTFEVFVKTGAKVAFNRFRLELYVSNPAYDYTYVLSLKYRQWFKVSRRIWQDSAGSDLANTPGSTTGTMTVLDLASETDGSVLVHLQSRPFSMGYQYCHVHRIVSMMRARLSGTANDRTVVGLYGSDNLQVWKLLAYAKRAGDTTTSTEGGQTVVSDKPLLVSQIRTTSAARSWRYYTVCIGGQVPTDTDLGPTLVDYEGVIRRIG